MAKKLPPSETKIPGVECRTRKHGIYLVTGNELRNKFTLWKENAYGYEKIATANNPTKLYSKIPW